MNRLKRRSGPDSPADVRRKTSASVSAFVAGDSVAKGVSNGPGGKRVFVKKKRRRI